MSAIVTTQSGETVLLRTNDIPRVESRPEGSAVVVENSATHEIKEVASGLSGPLANGIAQKLAMAIYNGDEYNVAAEIAVLGPPGKS